MLKSPPPVYGRSAYIAFDTATCDNCGKETRCMIIDLSDGEYSIPAYCRECIDHEFSPDLLESPAKNFYITIEN